HKVGLVHRDVKPGNVLLAEDGVVKLADFGISRAARNTQDSVPGTSTSPDYLAPERAGGGEPTVASDLYSLGIMAFACLTGSLPFTATPADILRAHREQPLPTPQHDIPSDVAALVGRLAAKDPADRPTDAAAAASLAASQRDLLVADDPDSQGARADR